MATIINGKALAKTVRGELKGRVERLVEQGIRPGLAVVLVGDDPASAVYVRSKTRGCARIGMEHLDHMLPVTTTQEEMLSLVSRLNADEHVHGILVQLPLPAHLDASPILRAVDPAKDVDGFHPVNLGELVLGHPTFVPCTPLGVLRMLKEVDRPLEGARAVVVGRSTTVGKPMAHLLMGENCTVTVAHSRTRQLDQLVGEADVLVAAVGRAELVKGAWIKKGATVIDVGINRVGERLVGDVEFEPAAERAGAITPVPGGVGPMTVAMLLANTVTAGERMLASRG